MTPLELVLGILIVFVGYWLPPVVQKVREYLALTGKKDYSRVQSVTSGLIGMEKKEQSKDISVCGFGLRKE